MKKIMAIIKNTKNKKILLYLCKYNINGSDCIQKKKMLPRLKWDIPETPISVARRFFGASRAQYVAAATHIK